MKANACWAVSDCAEAAPSSPASEACYGRPENIGVLPVVVPELSFRNVERQIFLADLVIAADDIGMPAATVKSGIIANLLDRPSITTTDG